MNSKVIAIKKDIEKKGFSVIENQFSKKVCKFFVNFFDELLLKRIKKKEYVGTFDNQVLYNYFSENKKPLIFVYHNLIDKVMKTMIDNDYVLTSPAARNRRFFKNKYFKKSNSSSGTGWHTDSRYVQGKRIKPSFSYFSIITLEDFTRNSGATHYVPNSHKYDKKPERNKNYNFKYLEAPAGSIIFLDTALWHKAGKPSDKSRWSIFNMYSSWFIKPYWQFNNIFSNKLNEKFDPKIQQLLHLHSQPPKNQNQKRATLKRVPE